MNEEFPYKQQFEQFLKHVQHHSIEYQVYYKIKEKGIDDKAFLRQKGMNVLIIFNVLNATN
jgi:hypothetical protein